MELIRDRSQRQEVLLGESNQGSCNIDARTTPSGRSLWSLSRSRRCRFCSPSLLLSTYLNTVPSLSNASVLAGSTDSLFARRSAAISCFDPSPSCSKVFYGIHIFNRSRAEKCPFLVYRLPRSTWEGGSCTDPETRASRFDDDNFDSPRGFRLFLLQLTSTTIKMKTNAPQTPVKPEALRPGTLSPNSLETDLTP